MKMRYTKDVFTNGFCQGFCVDTNFNFGIVIPIHYFDRLSLKVSRNGLQAFEFILKSHHKSCKFSVNVISSEVV